jgi:hypothetical protein
VTYLGITSPKDLLRISSQQSCLAFESCKAAVRVKDLDMNATRYTG